MRAATSFFDTSPVIAGAFAVLAVDGELYAGTAADQIMMELIYLEVIERDEASPFLRYTAVHQLTEMLEPYRVLIAQVKQVRGNSMMYPSLRATEFLNYLAQQIGNPLAESWKRDLMRRRKARNE
jgi:hypothetical protein